MTVGSGDEPPQIPLRRLFIANRGEIARRIATTAKRLGMEVAVITDRQVPPAFLIGLVDKFVRVPEETTQLYLDGPRMVALARECGCDCLHPGFGFLSENAVFARQVIEAGLVWIGPSPESIAAMASKSRARSFALANDVPCIEALGGFVVDEERQATVKVQEFAKRVGYPVLVKAALGGGGKGMRLVRSDAEISDALLRASSEALKSFGDPTLVVEKYLTSPRHVEVQILGDQHGTVVTVGDRDCSVQRRHQKVLEEAPAPCLTDETRAAMHAAAVRLAVAVQYYSAGTVEILVDGSAPMPIAGLQNFYFLEMNTRLQVEHPVTEEVFGLDLVEWQLRVAAGQSLPDTFGHLRPRGHSIEARIYAEDPQQDYLPMPSPLYALYPDLGAGMRWEIGVEEHDTITAQFDPMIAKAIATGPDRLTALDRMASALERTVLCVHASNVPLLIALVRDIEFRGGGETTHYLADHFDTLKLSMGAHRARWAPLAQAVYEELRSGRAPVNGHVLVGGSTIADVTRRAFLPGGIRQAAAEGQKRFVWGSEKVRRNGTPSLLIRCGYGYTALGDDDDKSSQGFNYVVSKTITATLYWVVVSGENYVWTVEQDAVSSGGAHASLGVTDITAPLPGKVVSVFIEPGQVVVSGEKLFVMESMKMELEVKAGKAGTIERILVVPGQTVAQGVALAVWRV